MMDGWLDGAQSELGGSPPMTKKEPKGQMIQRDSSSLLTFDAASAFASGRLDWIDEINEPSKQFITIP